MFRFKRILYKGFESTLEFSTKPIQKPLISLASSIMMRRRFPTLIQLEPISTCNLRCPICPIGSGVMDRNATLFPLPKFKTFIDGIEAYKDSTKLFLTGYGEPLLHPEIGKIAGYATLKGFSVFIETNGTKDRAEDLIENQVSNVWYAVDGLDQKTYETYRRGGKYMQVIENLEKICSLKRNLKSELPIIRLQFIVMKHNEHQIPEVLKLGQKIGVDEISLKHVQIGDYHNVSKAELEKNFLPHESKYVLAKCGNNSGQPFVCPQGFATTILANGDIVMCCIDYNGNVVVGNIFSSKSFIELWNSKRGQQIREIALSRKHKLCQQCDLTNVEPYVYQLIH